MSDITALVADNLEIWTGAIERKSGAGRGGGKRINLYGIERLRALILDLAVLGKLVPQDHADEPATKALERLAKARAAEIKAGLARKPKSIATLPAHLRSLPSGWVWTQLGTIAEISPSNVAGDDAEASFVPMAMVSTSISGEHEAEIRRWGEIKKGFTHFADGDLGLAKITPCFENGKAAIFQNLRNGIGAGTTELHIARPWSDDVNRRYILLTMKTGSFLANGEKQMTGTAGQKRVTRAYFEATPLPFPPLAEQRRIVAKVDELMGLCDALERESADALAAHQTLVETVLAALVNSADAADLAVNWARLETHFDSLFTTETSIDALKQTILDLAVRGKLVEQIAADGAASDLLKKIMASNAKRVAAGGAKKMRSQSETSSGMSPFDVPPSWVWTSLDRIAYKLTDGAHHTPTYTAEGVPFLSVKDMSSGKLDFSDTRFISEEQHAELYRRCDPEAGDLLITKVGTTGVPVIVDTDEPFSLFVSVALIKAPWELISVEYLRLLVDSPFVRKQSADGTQGIGNKNLVLRTIGAFQIPLPPRAEQHRIVAKADELMALCDALKARLANAAETRRNLADAIVERAAA